MESRGISNLEKGEMVENSCNADLKKFCWCIFLKQDESLHRFPRINKRKKRSEVSLFNSKYR